MLSMICMVVRVGTLDFSADFSGDVSKRFNVVAYTFEGMN